MKFNERNPLLFQEADDPGQGGGGSGGAPAGSDASPPDAGGAGGGSGGTEPAGGGSSAPANILGAGAADPPASQGAPGQPGTQPPAANGEFSFSSLIGVDGQFLPNYAAELAKAHPDLAEGANILSRYKDPVSLAKALVHARQLAGRKIDGIDDILNVARDDEQGMAIKREKLGIPDTADGYQLKLPDKLPDGTPIPQELREAGGELGEFQKWAHENDVPKALAEKLVEFDMQRTIHARAAEEQVREAAHARQLAQDTATLKQELGSNFDRSMDLVVRLLERGGMSREQIRSTQALADLGVMRALVKLAGESGEDQLPSSSGQSSGLDAGAQAKDIVNNPQNPLYKAYWAGDESANARVQSLLKQEADAKRQLAGAR